MIDRLEPQSQARDLVLEIVGFRHHAPRLGRLSDGMALDLTAEPTNAVDPDAVRVDAAGVPVGYVNRLQASSIAAWLQSRTVSCWLCRQNGRPGSPSAFAFLSMRARKEAMAA